MPKLSRQPHPVLLVLACLSLALASAGCRSLTGPGSASFASVTIKGHSEADIAVATAHVFRADGYRTAKAAPGQIVFEKEASRATSIAREGFMANYTGDQTIDRVRVQIVPLSDGTCRLQCQAFMVTGGSDPFFQQEERLANLRAAPYQSLLNNVKQQLK
jgi:hypothetical protein